MGLLFLTPAEPAGPRPVPAVGGPTNAEDLPVPPEVELPAPFPFVPALAKSLKNALGSLVAARAISAISSLLRADELSLLITGLRVRMLQRSIAAEESL